MDALPLIWCSFWLGRGSLKPFWYALPLTQYSFWLGACSLVPFWDATPRIQYSFWLGRGSLVPFLVHPLLLSTTYPEATCGMQAYYIQEATLLKLGKFITRYSLVLLDDRGTPTPLEVLLERGYAPNSYTVWALEPSSVQLV